ncbi:GTP-binding protein [Desulfoluna sp.]|uniref:CobW family GTP-binding protein n=1 Tax=Desulfoluna sp. TaxID=2045199 RepID=UPI00260B7404|nr:GTP-binding protein [Desulfoluna sp.]
MNKKPIPVTILTGGLGAGKTTLLNHIITSQSETRFAIIENEFGEIGIDQDLIDETQGPTVVELSDGCICCTIRNDLVKALSEMYERRDDFESLIIETTGLAEPGPVAQVLIAEPELTEKFKLNAVVTLVDAEYVMTHIDTEGIVGSQIGFADIIVLNKLDRVNEQRSQEIQSRLTEMNAQAKIVLSEHARIDTEAVLSADGFSLDRALELDPDFLKSETKEKSSDGFMGLLDRVPSYHDDISSVGIVILGDLDDKKLEMWLSFLTMFQGEDILRIKGVLSICGKEERFVIQGVHTTLTGTDAMPWGDAARESRILIIGRLLDRPMLEKGFMNCLA